MNAGVLLILTILYALGGFLLLCLCLWSPWPRRTKIVLIVLVTGAYFGAYRGIHAMQGWAAAEALPPRFALLAVVIEEPNKERGTRGQIFLWVNPLEDGKPAGEPRAYRIPYERGLHSVFDEAMKKSRNGNVQMGTAEPKRGNGGTFAWLRPGNNENQKIRVTDMPAPQLPEK